MAQFLERLSIDLGRTSIHQDLIAKVAALEGRTDIDASATDSRVAWAIIAGLRVFTGEPRVAPPPARSWALTDALLESGPVLLEPQKKHLTVQVTEVRILDDRTADVVAARKDARELHMIHSLEELIARAKTRSYGVAADAFYDFVYRLHQDTERLPEWAERLA